MITLIGHFLMEHFSSTICLFRSMTILKFYFYNLLNKRIWEDLGTSWESRNLSQPRWLMRVCLTGGDNEKMRSDIVYCTPVNNDSIITVNNIDWWGRTRQNALQSILAQAWRNPTLCLGSASSLEYYLIASLRPVSLSPPADCQPCQLTGYSPSFLSCEVQKN